MDNINLNSYKIFYELCKYKSFSEASKHMYISQSAISKSIKKLELELNIKLFIRNKGGVELTEKGKELLYYIDQSFNSLEIAKRNMEEYNDLKRGKLSIGMPSNIGTFYLFDKILKFHNDYPNIEITITTGSTTYLLELLNKHSIDFVIDTPPFKNVKDLTIRKLDKFNYCFISKEKNSIESLKELEDKQLILPIPGTDNRNKLDLILDDNSINFTNIINIHTTEMIIAAVKNNIGIGYVIENLVETELINKELFKVNIKEKLPVIDLDLVYNKNYLTKTPLVFLTNYMNLDMK